MNDDRHPTSHGDTGARQDPPPAGPPPPITLVAARYALDCLVAAAGSTEVAKGAAVLASGAIMMRRVTDEVRDEIITTPLPDGRYPHAEWAEWAYNLIEQGAPR